MTYRLRGSLCDGEFEVLVDDIRHVVSHGLMRKEVLVDLITHNVDKLTYFDLVIDGEIEYMDEAKESENGQ